MNSPAPRALALRTTGVTYPGTPEHISAVRADLRPILRGCPMADDVILCASELAANAAIHSHSRLPGGTFTVRAITRNANSDAAKALKAAGAEVAEANLLSQESIEKAIAGSEAVFGVSFPIYIFCLYTSHV